MRDKRFKCPLLWFRPHLRSAFQIFDMSFVIDAAKSDCWGCAHRFRPMYAWANMGTRPVSIGFAGSSFGKGFSHGVLHALLFCGLLIVGGRVRVVEG